MVIILSCLISIAVNFSTFLVIGKTSPVTYQVLGHLKTCLVLAFGYIIVHDPFSWRNILGIMVAMVGMIIYSYCCALESQQKPVEGGGQMSQVCFMSVFMFLCFLSLSWTKNFAFCFVTVFIIFRQETVKLRLSLTWKIQV